MRNNTCERLAASAVLVALSPVILVGLAVSTIKFKTQPIFKQTRVGLYEREFDVIKIRTLKDDKCICWLRQTHIDEFLQLINIIRGEMSFVGPRPVTKDELKKHVAAGLITDDGISKRHSVCPGIAGLAQATCRRPTDFFDYHANKQRYDSDIYYVKYLRNDFIEKLKIFFSCVFVKGV